MYHNDSCVHEPPYSCQARINDSTIWHPNPTQLYEYLHDSGYASDPDTNDFNTKITHVVDYDIVPGDTLTFYTVLATVLDGDLDDLRASVMDARAWLQQNIAPVCVCCFGMRGDIDYNLEGPNIADLVYLVGYMFQDGPMSPCADEADIDGNGEGPDISDVVHLVGYMFQQGPPPADCP